MLTSLNFSILDYNNVDDEKEKKKEGNGELFKKNQVGLKKQQCDDCLKHKLWHTAGFI